MFAKLRVVVSLLLLAALLGCTSSPTRPLAASATPVTGRLAPEEIQRVVRSEWERFRGCYEDGLRRSPSLAGRVSVRFIIERDGSLRDVAPEAPTMPDPEVVSCVVARFATLRFPPPHGGVVIVTYPILFSPDAADAPPSSVPPAAPPPSTHLRLESDDPTLPLVLYRVELELTGVGYRRMISSASGSAAEREDRSSQLEDVHATAHRALCLAPCDLDIGSAPGQRFFLGGEGITPSSQFFLEPGLRRVGISASPKSSVYRGAGTALAATAGSSLFVGSVLFFPNLASHDEGMLKAGGTLLASGSVLLGAGIALLLVGRTTYRLDPPATWRF